MWLFNFIYIQLNMVVLRRCRCWVLNGDREMVAGAKQTVITASKYRDPCEGGFTDRVNTSALVYAIPCPPGYEHERGHLRCVKTTTTTPLTGWVCGADGFWYQNGQKSQHSGCESKGAADTGKGATPEASTQRTATEARNNTGKQDESTIAKVDGGDASAVVSSTSTMVSTTGMGGGADSTTIASSETPTGAGAPAGPSVLCGAVLCTALAAAALGHLPTPQFQPVPFAPTRA